MEEENVSKDFTNKQITIDIPEKSERPLTKELESEYPFIISGSAAVPPDKLSMVTCAAVSPDNLAIPVYRSPDTRNWIIYKVPNKLRKIRPAAYTPQLVSIGPVHHGKSNLKVMEYHKAKFMNEFLGRSFCNHIKEEGLIHEITEIKEEEGKLVEKAQRSYQEETFEPKNKKKYWEVPKNILRDACFILELFLRNHENQFSPPDEEDKKTKQLSDKEIKDNACFIFERFFRNHQIQSRSPDKEDEKYSGEYILSPWVKAAIKQDLILLENQLPFFVLDRLFDFIFNHPSKNINHIPDYLPELKKNGQEVPDFLIIITCEFFIGYYKYGKPCTEENSKSKSRPFDCSTGDKDHWKIKMKDIMHFTDLVRKFMCDKKDFPKSSEYLTLCLHSAKQLDNAGVKFGRPKVATYLAGITICPDVKDNDKRCWWNCRDRCWWNGRGCCWINGCCGINCLELKIPQLKVDDNTECIFRNVMALEQFVYPKAPRICNYIFVLDQLIDTVEDVVFLVDKGIIENWLTSPWLPWLTHSATKL
nr:uncharacterized protein LOC107433447 [Ziziphus jujuba var. spinosa]